VPLSAEPTRWTEIESYGQAKYDWLKESLALPNGIPSHDTIARLFIRLDPEQLQGCFLSWIEALTQTLAGQVVAIDSKPLRHSFDKSDGKGAIHMVSAWATSNRLVLGQLKVDEKSNEITAIPELLRVLALSGCIVTIDAMGCQKNIAQHIIYKDADYTWRSKGIRAIFWKKSNNSWTMPNRTRPLWTNVPVFKI
jgi:DDE_Tnp_1-associated/Transposase DDE domain